MGSYIYTKILWEPIRAVIFLWINIMPVLVSHVLGRAEKTESVFELEENLNQKTETTWDDFQIFSEAL